MAQFDVHRNPGRTRRHIPFVVVVQSAVFDDYGRRLVIPLVLATSFGKGEHKRFNPTFIVEGIEVILHPLETASIPVSALDAPIASLADAGDDIISAIDELITRAYG
ncbi:MAG: CcdB family protein [Luteimonas sp.]